MIRRDLGDRVTVVDGREKPVEAIVEATKGGVDVALEISGHPVGINNAIKMTRPAGHIVNLGLPKADSVSLEGFSTNYIFKGLTMHAVIGREMFRTWDRCWTCSTAASTSPLVPPRCRSSSSAPASTASAPGSAEGRLVPSMA